MSIFSILNLWIIVLTPFSRVVLYEIERVTAL